MHGYHFELLGKGLLSWEEKANKKSIVIFAFCFLYWEFAAF
tara:strand:- start:82 stop:204 length:123 start_codon:yes stop_codon:yes gene_type:complete